MQKEYKLDETNERHSKHLCLGRVVICAKNSDYGIVYQYSDEENASECSDSRLYIFNKDVNLDIPSKTIITFLKDFDNIKKGIYGKTGADWDSAPEQTGTLLMRQS